MPDSGPIATGQEAGAYLESLVRTPRAYADRARFAQQAIAKLLARVGNPHRRLKVIHIAGSKGKGSTALMIEAILQAAGFRVGTFTSPHLERWTERYRINSREIEGSRLAAALEQLRPEIAALASQDPDSSPSFFEAATAAALLLFQQEHVDYAVLETGLGGRLDATNIVAPLVTCITSIELEHTDKLGNTLAAIASEKAGIIKPGIPVVAGALPAEAMAVVSQRAAAVNAPLIRLDHELQLKSRKHQNDDLIRISCNGFDVEISVTLPAPHLTQLAALAVACVLQLPIDGRRLQLAAGKGLARLQLPGRCEILARRPWLFVDAAHTQASLDALVRVLTKLPVKRIHLLLSMSGSKNPRSVCAALLDIASTVTVTQADSTRSMAPSDLATALYDYRADLTISIIEDPVHAINDAYRRLAANDLLCATGSVYMAGLARKVFTDLVGIATKQKPSA